MLATRDLTFTAQWCSILASSWKLEVPLKTHHSRTFAVDGTPEWTREFAAWLERDSRESKAYVRRRPYENAPQRVRTTRAFRKLRAQAPQEFLALYDACVLNPLDHKDDLPRAFAAIARRLNERAISRGFPERYDAEVVGILIFSATHKISARWL